MATLPTQPASEKITAASSQAPTAINLSPVKSFNATPALQGIRDYYQIPEQTFAAQSQAAPQAFNAGIEASNARAAASQKASLEMQKLNPSNYTFHYDPTGKNPTQILDPTGNPVSAGDFSRITGASPADYLTKSTNVNEQKFVQAYNNYQGFMQALLNKDKTKLQAYYANNQGLKNMKPEDVRKLFMAQYGNYLGIPQQNVPYGVNREFAPDSSGNPALAGLAQQLGF